MRNSLLPILQITCFCLSKYTKSDITGTVFRISLFVNIIVSILKFYAITIIYLEVILDSIWILKNNINNYGILLGDGQCTCTYNIGSIEVEN